MGRPYLSFPLLGAGFEMTLFLRDWDEGEFGWLFPFTSCFPYTFRVGGDYRCFGVMTYFTSLCMIGGTGGGSGFVCETSWI